MIVGSICGIFVLSRRRKEGVEVCGEVVDIVEGYSDGSVVGSRVVQIVDGEYEGTRFVERFRSSRYRKGRVRQKRLKVLCATRGDEVIFDILDYTYYMLPLGFLGVGLVVFFFAGFTRFH